MFEQFQLSNLPAADEGLRDTVRSICAEVAADFPLEVRARSWSGFDGAFSRRLGAAGLLGLTLPKCYGGQERGPPALSCLRNSLLAVLR
jgi:alkylation response protein AidB-like acyl-CoA dehydrogenase